MKDEKEPWPPDFVVEMVGVGCGLLLVVLTIVFMVGGARCVG